MVIKNDTISRSDVIMKLQTVKENLEENFNTMAKAAETTEGGRGYGLAMNAIAKSIYDVSNYQSLLQNINE